MVDPYRQHPSFAERPISRPANPPRQQMQIYQMDSPQYQQQTTHNSPQQSTQSRNTVSAYEIFNLRPEELNKKELNTRYKRLVRKYHPDKPGGKRDIFILIERAYEALFEEINRREGDRPHNELRSDFQRHVARETNNGPTMAEMQNVRFNPDKFNKVFEETRIEDPYMSGGYGDVMAKRMNKPKQETISVQNSLGGIRDPKAVASEFERKYTKRQNQNQLAEYRGPQEIASADASLMVLGADKPKDFTKAFTLERKGLDFTDYLKAHSEDELGPPKDPNAIKQRSYNEVENERRQAPGPLSDAEQRWIEKQEQMQKQDEYMRQERLSTMDRVAAENAMRSQQRLIESGFNLRK